MPDTPRYVKERKVLRPGVKVMRDGGRREYGIGLRNGPEWAGYASILWGWRGERPEGCAREVVVKLSWWGRS